VTTLTGQATVARVSLPQPLPLRFKDDVFVRDRISTAERSIVRVLLGGKALVTARELSVLTITEEMGRSTVELGSGKIAVGVARQRMRPGEIVEIRTPNVVAAVRGTVLVVEIIRSSADSQGSATPPTTNVHVIHGLVDVFSTGAPGTPPVQVATLQTYSQIGSAPGTLRNLSREAAESLFADLRSDPQFSQGPGEFMVGMEERELQRATALAHAILPDTGSGAGGPNGEGQGESATDRNDPRLTDNRNACSHGGCDRSGDSAGYVAPLTTGSLLTLSGGASLSTGTPFFKDTGGNIVVTGDAVGVTGNSTLTGTGAAGFLATDGTTMSVAGNVLNETGPNSSVTLIGNLLEQTNGATVTAQRLARVNAALLDASAPLLSLTGKSVFTSSVDAVDLASVNRATQFASLAKLDASTFTVKVGAALNLTGGSVVTVLGDLFTLGNQSTLKILSGPLISLGGNSSLNITGAILNFLGAGNTVTVTNSLCAGACQIISGIPVLVTGGAPLPSLTNPIKNLAGNTITYSSASAALISISGASSQITVQGK
jgi:hypothetical protein